MIFFLSCVPHKHDGVQNMDEYIPVWWIIHYSSIHHNFFHTPMIPLHQPNVQQLSRSHHSGEYLGQLLSFIACVHHHEPRIFQACHSTGSLFRPMSTEQGGAQQNWSDEYPQYPFVWPCIKQGDLCISSSLARRHLDNTGQHLDGHGHQNISLSCMICIEILYDVTIVML